MAAGENATSSSGSSGPEPGPAVASDALALLCIYRLPLESRRREETRRWTGEQKSKQQSLIRLRVREMRRDAGPAWPRRSFHFQNIRAHDTRPGRYLAATNTPPHSSPEPGNTEKPSKRRTKEPVSDVRGLTLTGVPTAGLRRVCYCCTPEFPRSPWQLPPWASKGREKKRKEKKRKLWLTRASSAFL